jgi:hypothetical protein
MAVQLTAELVGILRKLLKDQTGHNYNDEDAHYAGLAIIRFITAKKARAEEPHLPTKVNKKEH